jgi:hypothetical protein
MSSSGGNSGGTGATSEEGMVARHKAWFIVSTLGMGTVTLTFEMSPASAEITASKHGALIHVMRFSVAPGTLSVLTCWFASFRVDDLANGGFDDSRGELPSDGNFSEYARH